MMWKDHKNPSKSFSFLELQVATRNFHPSVAYGSYAGSSTLYKGWIDEQYAPRKFGIGIPIAVKRLKQSLQGDKEWLGFFVPSNIPSGVPRRLFSPLLWESESAYHWTVIKDMGKIIIRHLCSHHSSSYDSRSNEKNRL
ncbi:HCO3- transporter family [Artemisia annua]|uniref:HCO3-transporter family n=1 Tax=Artemisia annua TaxID=35608 RepID=A0A2U1N3E3_ARTAN|nr:HCO3- transporter family [Artemisia annua]